METRKPEGLGGFLVSCDPEFAEEVTVRTENWGFLSQGLVKIGHNVIIRKMFLPLIIVFCSFGLMQSE